nr:1,2-phenylacetyl-CoA epoxidase subunit B [Crenobacter luteus]
MFLRLKAGLDHKHVGSVDAKNGAEAVAAAVRAFGDYAPGSLWVAPSDAIVATEAEERDPFFEPMADKTYRLPTFYRLPDAVNNM